MDRIALEKEIHFRTSRSGGSGGQNVNKVSTKVEILFDIRQSALFNDEEKQLIDTKLAARINKEGILQVVSQSERTQLGNKHVAFEKLIELLESSLTKQKPRKATKISKAQKERRFIAKKRQSELKRSRSERNF